MNKIDRYKILIRHMINEGIITSQKDLGSRMGYSQEATLSQIINGKVKEPKDFIERLSAFIPGLNRAWLENGVGSMINSATEIVNEGEQHFHGDINGNNPQFAGRDFTIMSGEFDKFISALTAQAELTKEAHDLTRRAQVQVDKAQAQMDRLITILELKLNITNV